MTFPIEQGGLETLIKVTADHEKAHITTHLKQIADNRILKTYKEASEDHNSPVPEAEYHSQESVMKSTL